MEKIANHLEELSKELAGIQQVTSFINSDLLPSVIIFVVMRVGSVVRLPRLRYWYLYLCLCFHVSAGHQT